VIRFSKPRTFSGEPRHPRSIRLADDELAAVVGAAKNLSDEKLLLFVRRLAAQLSVRSVPVDVAIQHAMTGLQHRLIA
jgi:hypothetical protein